MRSPLRRIKKWPEVMIIITFIISFGMMWKGTWKKDHFNDPLRSDGLGYYSYLPAVFIYHDATFHFADSLWYQYPNFTGTGGSAFCNVIDGKKVDKYFAGESVLVAPFFLCSHLAAKIFSCPADGYSPPYAIGVCLAALFYSCLGLFFLVKLFRLNGVPDRYSSFIILLIFWGTNLSQYAIWEPAMSHSYSFAMVSMFVFYAQRLMLSFRRLDLIWLGITLGLIVIIRPVNLLIVLILPFLAGDKATFVSFFRNCFANMKFTILAILSFFAMVFIQLLAYKIQSGHWYVYAYTKEGFHFNKPHFLQSLFSYSNGAFVYAPILFIAMFGLIPVFRKSLFKGFSFLVFFSILIYVISCWWYWTYAGAFGMRPLVEYYPVFAMLLCTLLIALRPFFRRAISLLILIPLVMLLQFQLWQFKYGIISYADMTCEKYWRVFLQSGEQYFWINTEPPMTDAPSDDHLLLSRYFSFDMPDSLVTPYLYYDMDDKHTSFDVQLGTVAGNSPFMTGFIKQLSRDSLPDLHHVTVDVSMLARAATTGTDANVEIAFDRGDSCMLWRSYPLIRQMNERWKWMPVHYYVETPIDLLPTDRFVILVKKKNPDEFKFDDVKLAFYR